MHHRPCHQAASMKGSKSSLWASMKSTQRSRICASENACKCNSCAQFESGLRRQRKRKLCTVFTPISCFFKFSCREMERTIHTNTYTAENSTRLLSKRVLILSPSRWTAWRQSSCISVRFVCNQLVSKPRPKDLQQTYVATTGHAVFDWCKNE